MGIDANLARFLLSARARGVNFHRTATLGRLGLFLQPRLLRTILSEFQVVPDPKVMQELDVASTGYVEPFLRLLGAVEIVAIDASSYQGATLLHDMNQPVPGHLKNRFDALIDGGTLEHIFNFPVAIKNCMEMVNVGGHFLALTPTNNWPGHGFYQFSAELFFRVFSKENGFELERALICECRPNRRWFQAIDPMILGRRAFFTNHVSTHLLLQARKLDEVPLMQQSPMQSDYVMAWNANPLQNNGMRTRGSGFRRAIGRAVRRVEAALPKFKVAANTIRDHLKSRESRLGSHIFPRIHRP